MSEKFWQGVLEFEKTHQGGFKDLVITCVVSAIILGISRMW